jgi:hypothetical protein
MEVSESSYREAAERGEVVRVCVVGFLSGVVDLKRGKAVREDLVGMVEVKW